MTLLIICSNILKRENSNIIISQKIETYKKLVSSWAKTKNLREIYADISIFEVKNRICLFFLQTL